MTNENKQALEDAIRDANTLYRNPLPEVIGRWALIHQDIILSTLRQALSQPVQGGIATHIKAMREITGSLEAGNSVQPNSQYHRLIDFSCDKLEAGQHQNPDTITLTREELEGVRYWVFYECDNCESMYLETPVTVCDCDPAATKFTKRILAAIDAILEKM